MPETTTYPDCTPCCQPQGPGVPTSCCPNNDLANTLNLTLTNGTGNYQQLNGVSFPITYDAHFDWWTDQGTHVFQCMDGSSYSTFRFSCVNAQFHLAVAGGCSFDSVADPNQVSCTPFAVGGSVAGPSGNVDWMVTP